MSGARSSESEGGVRVFGFPQVTEAEKKHLRGWASPVFAASTTERRVLVAAQIEVLDAVRIL